MWLIWLRLGLSLWKDLFRKESSPIKKNKKKYFNEHDKKGQGFLLSSIFSCISTSGKMHYILGCKSWKKADKRGNWEKQKVSGSSL